MKTYIASVILSLLCYTGYGQQINQNNVPPYLKKIDTLPRTVNLDGRHYMPPPSRFTKEHPNHDTTAFKKAPMMILKLNPSGKLVKMFPSLGFIKQEDIASLEILPHKKADSLFGPAAKYGVIVTTLVPSVKTYTTQQYLAYYKLEKYYKNLPIYMDYNRLLNTDGMLFTNGNTKSVTIEKDATGKAYISILTNQYPNLNLHYYNDKEEHERWAKEKNK
ncbi:MAG: hypothetical protein V4581_12865 [Bacteroidota bacterium]